MVTEEIKTIPSEKSIDWDTVQVLKCEQSDLVVLTNGHHTTDSFQGTVLLKGSTVFKVGQFVESFGKKYFKRASNPFIVKFKI